MKFIKMFAFPVAFTLLAIMTFRREGADSPWFWFEASFAVWTLCWDGGAAWLWSLIRPKPPKLIELPSEPEPTEFTPHAPGSSPGDCTLCARILELRKEKGSAG